MPGAAPARPGPACRAASRTSGRAARRALHAGRCLPAPSGRTHPRAPAPAGRRLGPAPPGFPLPQLRRAAPGFPHPPRSQRAVLPVPESAPPRLLPPPLRFLLSPPSRRTPGSQIPPLPPLSAGPPLLRGSHVVAPKPRREREAPQQKRGWDRLRWWRRGAALEGRLSAALGELGLRNSSGRFGGGWFGEGRCFFSRSHRGIFLRIRPASPPPSRAQGSQSRGTFSACSRSRGRHAPSLRGPTGETQACAP